MKTNPASRQLINQVDMNYTSRSDDNISESKPCLYQKLRNSAEIDISDEQEKSKIKVSSRTS